MEKLESANKRLKTARNSHESEYEAEIAKLDEKEIGLKERLRALDKKKLETALANGTEDASGEDIVEVNAGGKIIAAKRSTLTQLKGTRMEALFSGRWDKKLQLDSQGRIFLDVNPVCFQAIVDYLNEMAISSEDSPPDLPSVDEEHKHILKHQLELFGLLGQVPTIDSNIVKENSQATQLHDWLEEGNSDGKLSLLFRSSRDVASTSSFHSKCDNKGCTLTVIETTDGFVFGGYSNTAWTPASGNYSYKKANKAFLFVLSGSGTTRKLKLKNPNDGHAIYQRSSYGPVFGGGHDMQVNMNGSSWSVNLSLGHSYESDPSGQFGDGYSYAIKEMEVFQVTPGAKPTLDKAVPRVSAFSAQVNAAINAKWESLQGADEDLQCLEESFKDEGTFISFFAQGDTQDVVTLNVCGTTMVTRRQTLQLCKESALASKFSGDEVSSEGSSKAVKEWNHEDVVAWLNQTEGISDSVVKDFEDNQVTGHELLALGAEGLRDFGVSRKGTIYLLLDRIRRLELDSRETATLIEHSPYCFEKILDHLRLEGSFVKGLVKNKHCLPVVRSTEKGRYEKVLQHLFPGDSAKIFSEVNESNGAMGGNANGYADY
ncbi:hypothetical protein ACHAXT_001738 [Thalassiosira profunda]